MPGYFADARVVVVGKTTTVRTIEVLREFTDYIVFDEAGHDIEMPGKVKTNHPVTATAAGIGEFAWRHVPASSRTRSRGPSAGSVKRSPTFAAHDADVIVGSFSELMRFGPPDLAGKAIITSTVSEERLEALSDLGANLVVDVTPQPFDFMIVPARYEAMVAATLPSDAELTTDDQPHDG